MAEDLGDMYDAQDYHIGCGLPHHCDEEWLKSSDPFAARIVQELQPHTVLDASCAMGFLAAGLPSRGVEA